MADSGITKKALVAAFKDLMMHQPFSKISIGDICDLCQMNRKSFYYHFKDKEDLVNWIFDTEFWLVPRTNRESSLWEGTEELIRYLYDNRSFYRKVLQITGPGSFTHHFRQRCTPVLLQRLKNVLKTDEITDFQLNFFTDGIVCAIKRWLSDAECLPPDAFLTQLESCICITAVFVYPCMSADPQNDETEMAL